MATPEWVSEELARRELELQGPAIGAVHMGYTVLACVPDGARSWVIAAGRRDGHGSPYAVWRCQRLETGRLIFSAGDYDQRTEYDAVVRMFTRAGYRQ